MKHFAYGLLLLGALSCTVHAADAQQQEAVQVLDAVAEAFRKAGGVKSTFTVHSQDGSFDGTICLKEEKFWLETPGVTTWFDGHTQWSYVSSNDEVNVSNPSGEELRTLNPYALLSIYKQGYRSALGPATRAAGQQVREVVITAGSPEEDLQAVVLQVSARTYAPVRITTRLRDGTETVIAVRSYQTGLDYPDTFFMFDGKEYPTAEIIDLR